MSGGFASPSAILLFFLLLGCPSGCYDPTWSLLTNPCSFWSICGVGKSVSSSGNAIFEIGLALPSKDFNRGIHFVNNAVFFTNEGLLSSWLIWNVNINIPGVSGLFSIHQRPPIFPIIVKFRRHKRPCAY